MGEGRQSLPTLRKSSLILARRRAQMATPAEVISLHDHQQVTEVDVNKIKMRFRLRTPQESKIALLFGLILISCELALKKNRFVKKRNYKHLRTPFSQFVLILCIVMLSMNVGGDFAIYGQR